MFRIFSLVLLLLVGLPSAVAAADWVTSPGGTVVCSALKNNGTCYVDTASATTSIISTQACDSFIMIPFGTSVGVMPQFCIDKTCTNPTAMMTSPGLTGTAPGAFLISEVAPNFIRVVATDNVRLSLKCGRQ